MAETTYDLMVHPLACSAFEWIGQPLTHCDNCSRPYWDHSHVLHARRDGKGGPFGDREIRKVITREQAAVTKRKWDR